MLGVMYNERYSKGTDEFVYLAVNMHWEEKRLALPKLPERLAWEVKFVTDYTAGEVVNKQINEKTCMMAPRSIYVFVASDNKNK